MIGLPIPKNAAALVPSTTCADTTDFVTKLPSPATGKLSSPLGSVLGTKSPGADYPSQTLATPAEFVTSPYTQDVPNRAVALDRNILSTVTKQTDTRNTSVRPRKRARRSRGKDKDANTPALDETENIPPPATREDNPSRGRRPSRARTGARPAKQGRSENRAGGTEAIDNEKIAVTRLVADRKSTSRGVRLAPEAVSGDSKSTSRRANAGRTRGHGRRPSGFRSNNKAPGNISPRTRVDSGAPGALTISEPIQDVVSAAIEEDGETPEVEKAKYARTNDEDQAVPGKIAPPADTHAALKDKAGFPVPTAEVDVSTVPPLPSSTRRRAKEYFQRRTRERSVDAETGPTAAEQGRGEEPNPRLHVKEGAGTKKQPARWNVPVNHDQFAFDPEASPFTPNATSSPRQGSLSSIGVQSFSSPTPLPPHGNRKVAPLALVKKSGKSDVLETIDSSSQPIPVTPCGTQGGQQEDTHTYYTGRNHALQAEQLALMRLQAYYSWLAGNIPTSAGLMRASEHVDLSGGGGGLSGGVALGRQVGGGQGRGRGKAQSRNSSGAYAHPKEHVVYSPHEHGRAQLAPGTPRELGRVGIMKTEQDEPDEKPEAVAQRIAQKWDGSWGLREAPGREVGWSWGVNGAGTSTESTG
ncbi:hypothetical protein EDB86DRAFT_2898934 [Lactarius hatsudake]|nr:hypothetical protein EDB86DRAFT_2898934 [Lactarius hatsudake]